MSSPPQFPFRLSGVLAIALVASASGARADENLLHGPHPFLKLNDLSAHVLIANGLGNSMSGAKIALDYGYRLSSGAMPLALDLSINIQHGACTQTSIVGPCGLDTGTVFETLAGVKWRFPTPVPLVPFAAAAGGMVFAFPNGADAGAGFMVRAVAGANYFFFDWLGLGAQLGFSMGSIGYDATFAGSHAYAVVDVGGGMEFQF